MNALKNKDFQLPTILERMKKNSFAIFAANICHVVACSIPTKRYTKVIKKSDNISSFSSITLSQKNYPTNVVNAERNLHSS